MRRHSMPRRPAAPSRRAPALRPWVSRLLACLATTAALPAAGQEELRVLVREADGGPMMGHTDAGNALYRHLQGELVRRMDAREAEVEGIVTAEEWRQRQLPVDG